MPESKILEPDSPLTHEDRKLSKETWQRLVRIYQEQGEEPFRKAFRELHRGNSAEK